MAIVYDRKEQIFSLHTKNTTYQMKADKYGNLLHLYYGPKALGSMEYLLVYNDRGFSGNPNDAGANRKYSKDTLPAEFPTAGTGDYRSPALIVQNADGSEVCDLRYVSHEIQKGKYRLQGLPAVYANDEEAETLILTMEDAVSKVKVQLFYGVLEAEDIITRSAVVVNGGETSITIEKADSACLDFVSGEYDFISFYGRHTMERNFQRTEIAHVNQTIGSRRGTSSHQYNPAVIVAEKETTEDAGICYGMVFVYSGGFLCEAEKDQFDQTRVLMGLQSEGLHYSLAKGEQFVIPETILTCSDRGFTELSKKYHSCIRNHICRGKYQHASRPVLINSWEAAYFDFTGETILNLAKEAAELGIDMVVMDDGWFGKRDDDNSGLGDWFVNEQKLGCSLGELIEKIQQLGVKFGIWIEPEMISEDSDLYRAHPDYAMQIPGRLPIRSRNQLVLDFSRKEVRDVIFEQICAVLAQGEVTYVKWDMNRSIADVYSAVNAQGNVLYDYVLGVYEFAEKLLQRYPNMLLEGCSGGGGRFDAGMLYYSPQIWCSDNTDAIDRLKIQYGTSFFYPIATMGSHVSAVPNHQTGRITSLSTRGSVALSGTFGYELNPAHLSSEEKEMVRAQVQEYKKYEKLIRTGTYYRLTNPFEDKYGAWELVSEDETEILCTVVLQHMESNKKVPYIRLKGLHPEKHYVEEKSGNRYCGAALMNVGIPIPVIWQYEAVKLHFTVEGEMENEM